MVNLVVIGGGPAGETAARVAAKRKATVSLIEKDSLGGLCLNRGCIPSKTLLSAGKKIAEMRRSSVLKPLLNETGSVQDVWSEMIKEKNRVVQKIRLSLEKLVKAGGIQILSAQASFLDGHRLRVSNRDKKEEISFEKAIVAVGSVPVFPPPLDALQAKLLDSDKILELEKVPKSMIILGGGAVGCEFACLFNALGARITILEKTNDLLPGEDPLIVQTLRKSLEKRGVQVIPSVTVQKAEEKGGSWEITCSNNTVLHAEFVLVCAGRKPNFGSLNLEKANVECSSRGIQVNSRLQTTHPDIYAVGDVNGLSLLAHAGSVQGEIAALNALGEEKEYDGSLVPRCLYTWPEVASVGSWISDAQKRGIETKSHRFFFEVSGRAACEGETEGLIQIVTAAETSQILGAQMIGPHATELIHILSLAIRQKMRKADLQEVIFAHPTFSEGIRMALER